MVSSLADDGVVAGAAEDPPEERDRWSDPDLRSTREALRDQWMQWRLDSAYRTRDWADAFR